LLSPYNEAVTFLNLVSGGNKRYLVCRDVVGGITFIAGKTLRAAYAWQV
jgi:hypothetical protein